MSAPDAVLRKVYQWLAYADEDLRLAQHSLTITIASPPYRLIAYHAQQCAEKCLKAHLVLQHVDFPYTHNLAHLLDLCAPHVPWTESLRDAEELTPFAITARYPTSSPRPATLRRTARSQPACTICQRPAGRPGTETNERALAPTSRLPTSTQIPRLGRCPEVAEALRDQRRCVCDGGTERRELKADRKFVRRWA